MILTDITNLVAEAVKATFGPEAQKTAYVVDYAEANRGDFYTNAPFQLAGVLKQPPAEIAAQLSAAIKGADILSAEAAGGYVNIRLKPAAWGQQLADLASWIKPVSKTGQKIQVEFISANPTGPLTLANARGGYLGDVLSNVLASQGNEVVREHYLNDAGGQIKKLTDSIRFVAGEKIEGERQYSGPYIEELAESIKPTPEMTDKELGAAAVKLITEMIKSAVGKMDVRFDVWFNEQSVIDDGTVNQVLATLAEHKLTYQKDGATWLASESLGDDRDRVLIKSTGEYIYLLNDIAYHYNIFVNRKFDKAIKIWGADHAGQVASLKLAVQRLIPDATLDFILLQLVHIIKDGQEFKSSKRAGTYITMDELVDEVGSDVARFFFLMRSADSQMDFDLDLAKEQSQKNPLFYVMYSYARANSIASQASSKGLQPASELKEPNALEVRLINQMSRWPGLLAQTATDYGVQRLTFYGIEIARLFHEYYESERIIGLTPEAAGPKLYLINNYIKFMQAYFAVLGISPQAKMAAAKLEG